MATTNQHYHLLSSSFDIDSPATDAILRQESSNISEEGEVECTPSFNNNNRKYTVGLLGITSMLLFADQNLMAPNLSAIAKEFHFNDMDRDYYLGGHIALAFFLVGLPVSYVVGALSDQSYLHRGPLFALTVILGEGACAATYFTTNYTGLYITRVLTGISIGGAIPILYSLLGDLFPPQDRNLVHSVVGMGTGCGIAFGQGLAGWIGSVYGWRLPFLIVSIPAIFLAILVWITVEEPLRGGMDTVVTLKSISSSHATLKNKNEASTPAVAENGEYHLDDIGTQYTNNEPTITCTTADTKKLHDENHAKHHHGGDHSFRKSIKNCCNYCSNCICNAVSPTLALLRIPTVLLVLLQGAPGCLPWGIVNTYLNDYLSTEKHMSVQTATSVILVFGLGNFIGMSIGGWGGNVLYAKDVRYPHLLSGCSAIFGILPMGILIHGTNKHSVVTAIVAGFAGIGSGVTGPIVKATLTNVTLPTSRGTAFALLNTFDDFGRGLGPLFVAILINLFRGDRQKAFDIGILGWLLCGLANLAIFYFAKSDELRMLEELRKQQQNDTNGSEQLSPNDTDFEGGNNMIT